MDLKSLRFSTEIWTGLAFLIIGLLVHAAGIQGILASAMAPFGVGLILSEILSRCIKASRERVKVRVRRDE